MEIRDERERERERALSGRREKPIHSGKTAVPKT
jgi:hypothetical protein